ncbi:MAG: S41 family peptidase [Gemmatimonadota bacterium]
MSRLTRFALAGLLLLPAVVGGAMLQNRADRQGDRLFDQVFSLVSTRFVDTLKTDELYERAARGLLNELNDPYATLISPKEMEAFTVETAGRYGGIGLLLEDHEGRFSVTRVFPNTPGEQAGVQAGDVVMAIDGKSTGGWEFQQITGNLKGEPGTDVTVDFGRPGVEHSIQVKLTRAVIRIPSVPFALMLDNKVGYIPLQQFSEQSTTEVQQAIRRLSAEGMQSLILDFRGNGGGYTDQAMNIANLFLPRGVEIYSVRSRDGSSERYVAARNPIVPSLPMIVLTDGYSASATEIVAGALQDHDRALVLGTTSFGKGLVQTVFPLENGYVMKMTTGKWLTPSGRSIQRPDRDVGAARHELTVRDTSMDSLDSRPSFHSDAGRIIYGGGAITPDVIVKSDTASTGDVVLARALAPQSQEAYLALYDLALERRGSVRPDFQVDAAWREDLYRRFAARGVVVDRAVWDAGSHYVDRLIGTRIALMAFGDSTAKRRTVNEDAQIRRALELIRQGRTQKDLLALVGSNRG